MRKTFLILFFATISMVVSAQNFAISAEMDSAILFVGEQTKLTFKIDQPADIQVVTPIFSDTIVAGLEIVERLPIDTIRTKNDRLQISQSYLLTAFDSALFYIEPLPFIAGNDTEFTQPLSLKVLPIEVDTTQHAIADIKPIYAPPFDWPLFWTIVLSVLGAAVLATLGYFAYRFWLKHRKTETEKEADEPQDLRPAHVIAYEKLDAIKAEKIWQHGRSKEFYTQLTDVVRDYINRRFEIGATEMTSAEILQALQPILKTQKDVQTIVRQLVTTADLVKFAKWQTATGDDEQALNLAYESVDKTKIEPENVEPSTEKVVEKTDEK